MRKVMAISVLGTVLGYAAVHFAFFAKPAPAPHEEPVAQADAEPAMLANVVEVTDTDALLDARPVQAGGVPFDAEPAPRMRDSMRLGYRTGRPSASEPWVPVAAEPIPPAAD